MNVSPFVSFVGPIGPLELGIILLLLMFFAAPVVALVVVLYLVTRETREEAGQDNS